MEGCAGVGFAAGTALGERQLSRYSIAFPQDAGRGGLNDALGNHSRHRPPVSLVRA